METTATIWGTMVDGHGLVDDKQLERLREHIRLKRNIYVLDCVVERHRHHVVVESFTPVMLHAVSHSEADAERVARSLNG